METAPLTDTAQETGSVPLSQRDRNQIQWIIRALLIGLLCAIPAMFCIQTAGIAVVDPDVGWQLSSGVWILHHHAFPHVDPFSRTAAGAPWQAYSWLFDLILLGAWHWLGLKGFIVLAGVLMALITAVLYTMVTRWQRDFVLGCLLTLAAMFCLTRLCTPRPWLFSMLFFAIELSILMETRRQGRSRLLLWLPVLFALWANIHIQFVDGLVILGIAALEPLLLRWWKLPIPCASARALWLTFAGCIAAPCLNPYGPRIYEIAWKLASQPGVLNTIGEEGAITFRYPGDFMLLFLVLAAAGVLFRYRHLAPFETLALAASAVLSFRSRRDVWIVDFVAIAILAAGLPAVQSRKDRSAPRWALALGGVTLVVILVLSTILTPQTNPNLQKRLDAKMPVQAVQFLRQHPEPGPLFNPYDWGGFLIWQLGEPVSIDGRAALYGDARIARSIATWDGGPAWAQDPDLLSSGVVIAPHAAALTQLLRTDPHFAVAWEDPVATVFVARDRKSVPDQNPALARALPSGRGDGR